MNSKHRVVSFYTTFTSANDYSSDRFNRLASLFSHYAYLVCMSLHLYECILLNVYNGRIMGIAMLPSEKKSDML